MFEASGHVGWLLALCLWFQYSGTYSTVLTPPYFNLADGRRITATATCGEDVEGPELYCKLIGASSEYIETQENILIQGQVCDHCDPTRPDKRHPPEYAVDGSETWWQSPPLSRGNKYNEVNLTIDLGQEFHVAYVLIKMANSPRPGVWTLEKSADNGQTWQPWQYFADTLADCESFFGPESLKPITRDDSVVCETQYSQIVPLEGGEIVVSLLLNRPSANDFFNSLVLQEFTRATNVRFRMLRTKNLLGHLMSVARQDPTVTRRYYYSIKDISIGGRCRCNGHADTCDITDPDDPYKLLCRCQHNTCGHNCEKCCPGFEQKAWSQSKNNKLFICEACNCFGHAEECVYNETIDALRLSIDIHGNYEGGGVCQNCRDNTEGINCDKCKPGFYRPHGYELNRTDVCQPCQCDYFYSTGNCAEGTGQCECRKEFTEPNCDSCSFGYFDYPNCKPCECHVNGTRGFHCEADGGQCPCKPNYSGKFCDKCSEGFYNFPECFACECNPLGALSDVCEVESGNCSCHSNFGGRTCNQCGNGYYDFPQCTYCSCDARGTEVEVCDKQTGHCLCKTGYGGTRCDQCIPGYNGYPDCKPCGCSEVGSASTVCDASGKCPCLYNFAGRTCEQCSPGYYKYPECLPCECNNRGSIGVSCDNEGKCQCRPNFDGIRCEQCKEGLYNFPICEECNCNPAGVLETFAGCGSLPPGELCQCKPRVHGRICDMCRPLYFNLQPYNPDGCEDCSCHMPGVAGNIAECDTKSGQCVCKPSVTSRQCDECVPGTYNLREDNLFGCTDCGCDIGGSVMSSCNKDTGQCVCQPRITGRTCKEPLQAHYFPTLYQFQYEAEDGHTPANTPVRYGFADDIFPGYSWKGYAVFSQLQNEIIREVYIQKPSLYRIVLRYINPNNESVVGKITVTPDNPSDTEQVHQVLFKPSRQPAFVTVAGPTSSIPSPFVMNPGQWSVSIKNDKSIFLDYFVLLPAAFYEVSILVNQVTTPCTLGDGGLCRHFQYPNLTQFDTVHGEGGYITQAESREPIREFLNDPYTLAALKVPPMPLLNPNQNELYLDLRITRPGPHILLVNYVTPKDSVTTSALDIEARTQKEQDRGRVTLYVCGYTMVCRQVVVDKHGKVAVFNFDTNYVNLVLKGDNANVAVESVVAIPEDKWHLDYLKPKQACVKKDGKCVQALFQNPGEAKKFEFEEGNEAQLSTVLPSGIYSNTTGLIYLDHKDAMVDVRGKVPHPGTYVFIVHYYQPDYPEFEMEVLLQNGQFYEAKLPLDHCPANSGCRSIVRQADGNTNFQLTENFVLTLKEPNHKSVWLDYVLVLPAESLTDRVTKEEPLDQTIEFITRCAQNNYYIDERVQGFCRDAVFSVTSAYNNGAIPCQCDYDGSLSFECEKFGGQCQCRPNVIGKHCEVCKTGYFGFPDCKSCDCPSTALCETTTGDCICPPHVTGENCDQCEPYTFGYDPIIGCESCNCNPLGVERGNLQCNLLNGTCECKENVVGRTCDHCQSGYWSFPYCQECDCDLRGTTLDICDQQTAECFCKPNVYGQACDLCKEGTFNIQEKNEDGCTKCFCFGKTTRCSSSSLYRSQIDSMEDWRLAIVTVSKAVNVEIVDDSVKRIDTTVGADLTLSVFRDKTVYFVAPSAYLNNQLTSYDGALNYSIFYTPGPFGSAVGGADVILHGAGMYLLHFAYEQPPASVAYSASLDIVESKFVLPTGLPTTREQIMQVLESLQGLYIRATYWQDSVTSRLLKVTLDSASTTYNSESGFSLSVEQCQCPPNYQGLSCEECADGYYRATTGPYGGYCVPCQCNGHATTCDKVTGICLDCKHNTTGDHCENCAVGYHGNATGGTPYDCLICACPLPLTSNNFATSCDVSEDGERISCECRTGYFGARCESCAAGYYGRPEVPNDYCKPCECSGNINPEDPGACDSVTGECTKCLNNTAGQSCQICAPGYFGDAVNLKDCQSCVCDRCGTDHCDHVSGICQCLPNVVGDKCDKCADQHYGFTTCQGCKACDCQLASESLQCDDISGQCRCKPGVVGRNCDRCASGYWQYTSTGCISCGCNTEYSVGVGCNPKTGQCECLPGVIGEKCDHCPHRWVLIEDQGCFECDTCTHALLDVTDRLRNKLQPITEEFKTVAASYFTTQRLYYMNNTVAQLRPDVNELSSHQFDIKPLINIVSTFQQETSALSRKAEYAVEIAQGAGGARIIKDAFEVEALILDAVRQSQATVDEISDLAYNLDISTGPQIELALKEAHAILDEISQSDIKSYAQEAEIGYVKAEELLARMEDFAAPAANTTAALESLRERIYQLDLKLDDLNNHSQTAERKALTTEALNAQNRNANLPDAVNNLRYLYKDANITLADAKNLLNNATLLFDDANKAFSRLNTQWQENSEAKDQLAETIADRTEELDAVQSVVNAAKSHSDLLTNQARTLDSLLTDTRYMSESAIEAANAYGNINHAIDESYAAARDALAAAENATAMSSGLGEKTATSNSRSTLLMQQAHKALEEAQQELNPQLADAISDVNDVININSKIDQIDSDIMKALEKIPLSTMKSGTKEVVQKADDARARSESALQRIGGIIAELPSTQKGAKQLYKDSEQARNAINSANNELDRVNSILPDLKNLADRLKEKPQKMTELGNNMKVDLELLKKRVAMARDLADRIKLGVTFFRNSTLELRNPESISHQGLNSHVSIYINTDKPNGLVLYLGNEKGTSRKMRRAISDDFMALEIQNGFPMLTMDLGSGPEQIIHNKSISDNNWYQIVMDRTGKSVRFTVREDLGPAHDHAVQSHTVEKILPGTSTLLNLDREHSKLFIGGYPVTFEIQPSVTYSSFDGRMEELVIGDQQVGLWNFVDAANINTASRDRDQLVNITTTTGFRLNGEGFISLDGHPYAMKRRSDVTLKFKTFAKDGLLFLALRDLVFLSVDLVDGHVRYQYNLGGGIMSISSPNTYNDGLWHTVDAVRVGTQGALKVDGISISQGTAPGSISELLVSQKLYIGGYPGEHCLETVTTSGFDGCIDEVQIGSTSVDLNQNINAFGVIAGCPNKFAGVVSFEGGARGYARWPNATARESPVQLILKFKTTSPNGMIAYAADGRASAFLSLENGSIIFKSGGQEVKTSQTTPYNDGQWHVVVATSSSDEPLRLDVDDYETFKSQEPAAPIRLLYGNLYFGGVPSNVDAAAALQPQFSGCIGDATLNGVVVNFGNLTDIPNAIIGKCLLDTPLTSAHRPSLTSIKRPEIPLVEEKEEVSPQPPPPVKPPVEEVSDSPETGDYEGETVAPLAPPEVVATTIVPTPLPTPVPMCKLPLYPISDADVTATSGHRFGTKFGSRVEYNQLPGRLKNKFEFSVTIKTVSAEGIIFYVTDQRHIDFISLYLRDGRIHYGFNCGSGPALIVSPNPYNDGEWHTIEFTRILTSGRLVIDDQVVATGDSKGSTKTINVLPPFYLGGIDPRISEQTKINLKGLNSTFEGCLKDFKMNGRQVGQPTLSIGVIPCSENVEAGSFFSADGGYIRAYDKFRVGLEIDIKLDIKPRNISGLLVSVHARKDYLVLQMIDGEIKFSVDNGKGEISAAYNPPTPHYFCDGEWHNIQAVKSKNVVTLSVDKNFVEPGIGMSSATDTKHPLYIGGHPNPSRLRGVLTTAQFVGCIRNVEINGFQEKLSTLHAVGNVTQSICPTT